MLCEDADKLRAFGFSDADILNIVEIAAYSAYVDRVTDGLGVELEDYAGQIALNMYAEGVSFLGSGQPGETVSSTQLDNFATAAMQALLQDREWESPEELARESYTIARAMMAERLRQNELPDSGSIETDVLGEPLELLELPLRINKKLRAIGVERIRDLTLTTETAVRRTGLGDESVAEIKEALHRHGLTLADT
ncbi:MAG: hypothetical protein KDB82_13180 [Planctomycetes bacterium]|nr:hypothetical protein [Planctomycetota bacterium]